MLFSIIIIITLLLSSSIQIRPEGLYLEEECSKNVEFPEEGHFRLAVYLGSRYKVCGDPQEKEQKSEDSDQCNSSNNEAGVPYRGWTVTPPWSSGSRERAKPRNVPPFQSTSSSSKKVISEPYFKRTIPLVTLGIDPLGRNLIVENTDDNLYIRVPESELSAKSIVDQASRKLGTQEELTILDSRWIPISEGKGNQHVY